MDLFCPIALTQVPEFSQKFFTTAWYCVRRRPAEIAAIRTALSQLHYHLDKFTRAGILCYSKTALLPHFLIPPRTEEENVDGWKRPELDLEFQW
ncbi:hypothetical protein CDAR_435451 [Caerostris darwini]|uniref:Uncharacterized protein n=1 Tax=Caerostris darwini TaxID=1538125 RepID=A0AAV4SGP5_9ARAC|nr:hypothetical protein CDAR_435451 [Caerostris darwini]